MLEHRKEVEKPMSEQKQVEVVINDAHYIIATDESPQYLHQLAREVDRDLSSFIKDGGLRFSDAAILCLIQYADSLKRSEESGDNLRKQIADYLSEAAKVQNDLEDARRGMEKLRKENELLRGELEKIRHENDKLRHHSS